MKKFGLSCKLTTTMAEAVAMAFKKFRNRMGQDLDANGEENYVFKVCGYNSYLLQRDTQLAHYQAVRECLREKSEVVLSLRRLTAEEKLEVELLAQPADVAAVPYSEARVSKSTDSVSLEDIAKGGVSKADIACGSKDEKKWRARHSLVPATQLHGDKGARFSNANAQSDEVQLSGWLHKKGKTRHNWSKRWFVLSGSTLRYYLDNSLSKEKGVINLESRSVQKAQEKQGKYPFAFEITELADGSSDRTYNMYAKSEQEMNDWMTMVAKGCRKASDTEDGLQDESAAGAGKEWPFRIRIHGIESAPQDIQLLSLKMRCTLCFGNAILPGGQSEMPQDDAAVDKMVLETSSVAFSTDPRWKEWLFSAEYKVPLLPPETRVGLMLVGQNSSGEWVEIAGVSLALFNVAGQLMTGRHGVKLWPHPKLQVVRKPELLSPKSEEAPRSLNIYGGMCGENQAGNAGTLFFELESFSTPVVAPQISLHEIMTGETAHTASALEGQPQNKEDLQLLENLADQDPLHKLSLQEKELLWRSREYCASYPRLLPKFLMAVQWNCPAAATTAHKLLVRWAPFQHPTHAMELLDDRFSDQIVRGYAVHILKNMTDEELQEYVLQLVQVLKYELYHLSDLARYLIHRALQNPLLIGTTLYWLLKSEMHDEQSCERFGVILQAYISNCASHRSILRDNQLVESLLVKVADHIKTLKGDERLQVARQRLAGLNKEFPATFQLGNWPHMEFKAIRAEKCRVMDSKKKPLFLLFENADPLGEPVYIIFKTGDDLRQDLMTLQMIRLMDSFWLAEGLDLRMKPYGCCATGDATGAIEVVPASDTIANIQQEYGGVVTGAFKKTPVLLLYCSCTALVHLFVADALTPML
jgi:hypothetical protein